MKKKRNERARLESRIKKGSTSVTAFYRLGSVPRAIPSFRPRWKQMDIDRNWNEFPG